MTVTGTQNINSLLDKFETVSLKELESKNLIDRFDSKYVFPASQLYTILQELVNDYMILKIDDTKVFSIVNQYYDTPEYQMFHDHVNGKGNRCKIRHREYLESDTEFMEIKQKTNKKRVFKTRMQGCNGEACRAPGFSDNLVSLDINPEILEPKLNIKYRRITLLHKTTYEKLTIDNNLLFKNGSSGYKMSGLIILEVKTARKKSHFKIQSVLRKFGVQPLSFSKYCFGVVMTGKDVKYNKIKPKILKLQKLAYQNKSEKIREIMVKK